MSHEGPFVACAFFCERLLVENDGVSSAIRIVDTVYATLLPDKPTPTDSSEARVRVELTLHVVLHPVDEPLKAKLRVVHVPPAGKPASPLEADADFSPGEGVTLNARLDIPLGPGRHLFEVFVGDLMVSRVPLKVSLGATPVEPVAP